MKMKNLLAYWRFLPYLHKILYFNFHYLPFRQALKLPILLYKPHLLECKGEVKIESDNIYTGMIQLGIFRGRLFQNTGIRWINEGGRCIFRGHCIMKNNSYVHIRNNSLLDIGDNSKFGPELRMSVNKMIKIGDNLSLGWMGIVVDSSFHRLKRKSGEWREGEADADREIVIGRNNWFGLKCVILKGTKTPDYCIFGATSFLNKDYSNNPSYILMAGNPLKIKAEDIWRDPIDDSLEELRIF